MSEGSTPAGRKAYEILHWAFRNPEANAQRALERISDLARSITDPEALTEVRDAGTMCSRLAGSTMSPESITDQAGLT